MDASPWLPQADEPARWYARFELYLSLGPTRSLERVFQLVCKQPHPRPSHDVAQAPAPQAGRESGQGKRPAQDKRPGQAWYKAARVWRWAERAAAWDVAERARIREQDEDRRLDAREKRLGHIERLMALVTQVLDNAKMGELTPEQARELLPQLRILFRDLIVAERVELGLPTVQSGTGGPHLPGWAHDDLATSYGKWQVEHAAQLVQNFALLPAEARAMPYLTLRNVLARLYPDEASMQRVADQAGLDLARVRLGHGALDNWHALLAEAQRVEAMARVIGVATAEYGVNHELREAIDKYRRQEHESQARAVAAEP